MSDEKQITKPQLQHHIVFLLAGIIGLVLVFSLSTPSDVSLFFLLLPFLLIGFVLYQFFLVLFVKVSSWHKRRLSAVLISSLLLVLLILSSLDQLSLLDIFVAVLFLVIAVAYAQYMHFTH